MRELHYADPNACDGRFGLLHGEVISLLRAYLNYPNPHMELHSNPSCREIGKMRKPNQRNVKITPATFSQVVAQLTSRSFQLGPNALINDLWLLIEFDDPEFENAVARYILRLLAKRYHRLDDAPLKQHC